MCKIILGLLLVFCLSASSAVPVQSGQTEFKFARLEYPGCEDTTKVKCWWTDFPAMDEHLVAFLSRLTNIRATSTRVKPSSIELFSFPMVYGVEFEQAALTDKEVIRLREYVARGGVIWLDDFHGDEDWYPVAATLHRILPNSNLVELTPAHELFHVFFDINKIEQVVNDGLAACAKSGCEQWENGESGRVPKVYGIFDANNRMEILLTYNTDTGDALEFADDPNYPNWMSIYGIRLAVNIIIFVLSH